MIIIWLKILNVHIVLMLKIDFTFLRLKYKPEINKLHDQSIFIFFLWNLHFLVRVLWVNKSKN